MKILLAVDGSAFTKKMLACIFLGFSSGMPLFVLVSLVPAWLRDNGVDLATIGLFALVGLPYTWKFLWSPIMDRFKLPFLGRRRGWALLTQVLLLLSIGLLGHFNPSTSMYESSQPPTATWNEAWKKGRSATTSTIA